LSGLNTGHFGGLLIGLQIVLEHVEGGITGGNDGGHTTGAGGGGHFFIIGEQIEFEHFGGEGG